jgi:hypothetical protein
VRLMIQCVVPLLALAIRLPGGVFVAWSAP